MTGPLLRMCEGGLTTVDVFNDTDTEELVHWYGLMVPAEVDEAAEDVRPRFQFMASTGIGSGSPVIREESLSANTVSVKAARAGGKTRT